MGSSNHKITHNNTDNLKMKKTEETTDVTEASSSREPHNIGVFDVRNNFKIGIYGWRKRCLYILVLTLLIMVIVNLALTLWVLKVMEFSSEGMGQLKIVSGGIRLEGKAFVLDSLIASSIRSKTGQPIIIESSRNITLTTRDANGLLENLIYLAAHTWLI
ncbi:Sarcoglycan complex subunit protein [Popillia japonica]|uniref:Sarcoglycan complex subunit protein n=1 Tax=Popillia japonica TaxID=7064 RepID=A0AAW1JWS9_POPJA